MACRRKEDAREEQVVSDAMYVDADGCYVVGGEKCKTLSEAYEAFRVLYNRSLGNARRHGLGTIRQRKSVISHRGIDFKKEYVDALNEEFKDTRKVKCYVLGIVDITYGYMYGEWYYDPAFREYDNDKRERYLDWLMAAGSTAARMCGRMDRLVVRKVCGVTYGWYVSHKRKSRTKKK